MLSLKPLILCRLDITILFLLILPLYSLLIWSLKAIGLYLLKLRTLTTPSLLSLCLKLMPQLPPVKNISCSLIKYFPHYIVKVWTLASNVCLLWVTLIILTYVLSYHLRHIFSGIFFLDDHFYNVLMKDDLHELPTFRGNDSICSTIDYIFMSQILCIQVIESDLQKFSASWTDHPLLLAACYLGTSPSSPDLWHGNTLLTRKPAYQHHLKQHLDIILPEVSFG